MKRLFDLLIVIVFAPLWLLVAGVVALVVWMKLGRPVLFAQDRAGLNGRPFTLRKFRSMREGEGTDEERLTKFGRFLRASSLDELPELWNVLKGEMSLVGPRPLPTRYLPRYTPEQNRRHEVLPGITGWAQVNGRNDLDWETKFRYDVDYVDSRSLWLDVKILFMTAWQVIAPRGINHEGEATMSEFMGTKAAVVVGALLVGLTAGAGRTLDGLENDDWQICPKALTPPAKITCPCCETVAKNAALQRHYREVRRLDEAASAVWDGVKSEADVARLRARLRGDFLKAIGGFPERTPLDARVTGVVKRDGYRVEKVLFEPQPKHYATGHLFLPDPLPSGRKLAAVLVACGHSEDGKLCKKYQRISLLAAKAGMAAFIYDPIDQGERWQGKKGTPCNPCEGHFSVGKRAHLIGWSQARFRIWDGIRALDYLCSRPEVDAERIGVLGQSGGGTLTTYLFAMDDRLKAAAPAGFITTMSRLAEHWGPQDSEQVIQGQLVSGLNHLSLLALRAPAPVCLTLVDHDAFPYDGAMTTFAGLQKLYRRLGVSERVTFVHERGRHGYYEKTMRGSIDFMRRWLKGETGPCDYGREDDFGLNGSAEGFVTATGRVADLPDYRSSYDILDDELARRARSCGNLRESVIRVTGIDPDVTDAPDDDFAFNSGRMAYWTRFHSPTSEVAAVDWWLGTSYVKERAETLIVRARKWAAAHAGEKMPLRAAGDDVVAAVHAKYLRPDLFGRLEIADPPPSWRKGFADRTLGLPITSLVYGALPTYDWTELVEPAPTQSYHDAVEAQFVRVRATIPELVRAAEAVRERIDRHPGALIDMPCDLGFGFHEEMIARAGGLVQLGGGHSADSTVLVPVRSWEDFGERGRKQVRTWCDEGCLVIVIGSAAGRPKDLPASFFLDNGAPDGAAAHGTKNVLVNALIGWMFCCEYAAAHSRTGKFPSVFKSVGSRDCPIVNSHIGSSDGLTRYFPCPTKIPAGELANVYWNQALVRFRQLREPHVQDGLRAAADAVTAALEQGRRVGVAGLGHLILEEPKHGLKSPMMGLRVVSLPEPTLMGALAKDDLLVWLSYFGLSTRHFDYTGPLRRARVKLVPSYSLPVPVEDVPKGEACIEQAWRVPDAEVAIPVQPGFMGSMSEIDRVVILRSLDEAVAARLAAKGKAVARCTPYDPYPFYDAAMKDPQVVTPIAPAGKGREPAPGGHRRTCGSGDQQLFCDDDFHWGAMKADGTVTVPAVYDQLDGWRGGELLVAYRDGKYGVIDWNGRTVIPFEWDLISGGREWCTVARDGRYGVLDMKTGALLTPCRYDWPAKAMGAGLVSAAVSGREGLFTTDGRQLVAPTWDAVDGVRGAECLVRQNGRHRLLTTDGSAPKVAGVHDEIAFLSGGGYRILDGRRYGILAADGSVRIRQVYDRLVREKGKGGVVRTLARRDGAWFLFEAKEQEVGELRPVPFPFAAEYVAFSGRAGIYRVAKDMRWGLVDAQGKVLAPLEYSYIYPHAWMDFRAAKGGTWSMTARELPSLVGAAWGALTAQGRESKAFKPDPKEFSLIP